MILLSRCLAYRRLPSGLNGLSPDVGHMEVLRPAAGSLPQEEALGLRSLPQPEHLLSHCVGVLADAARRLDDAARKPGAGSKSGQIVVCRHVTLLLFSFL